MIIYKITNIINNKIYIGQTVKTADERLKQHIYTATKHITNTHLAHAIRKYGQDNFKIEIIDTAKSQEELDYKENYWINALNTINNGYNMTDSSPGGNTYLKLSPETLISVKEKISISKKGGLNPKSVKIKCKNITTNEELFFTSLAEGRNYFKEKDHNFITRRVTKKTKCLYKKQWLFAYQNEEYPEYTIEKNNHRKRKLKVTILETKETFIFNSIVNAEKYFNLKIKSFSNRLHKKGNNCIAFDKFLLTILN